MRVVLENGAVLDVYWDGERIWIDDKYIVVDNWTKAKLNYSSYDEVFVEVITRILEKSGFEPVKFYGEWRI